MKKDWRIIASVSASGFLLLSSSLVFTGNNSRIPDLIESFYTKYPQQKVYISMDKPAYQAGESIWYKAYIFDATTHQGSALSKNLYLEVNNSFGRNLLTHLCKIEDGYSYGSFSLPDTIGEGIYEIMAYTNWMRNFGEEFFFRKHFNIWNPEHAATIYRNDKNANKQLKKKSIRKAEKTDLQFFPEGGDLVAGLTSRVGFKAVNDLGIGIDTEGTIFDNKKNQIVSFSSSHLGMGAFELTPEEGKKYYAELKTSGGRTSRFKLPEVLSEGYILKADNLQEDEIRIDISSSFKSSTIYLVAHVRGKVYHSGELQIVQGKISSTIDKRAIPTGILHLTLFDQESIGSGELANLVPRCERLVFVKNQKPLTIRIEGIKRSYQIREKVEMQFHISDENNQPVRGNFNLSVADRDLSNESGDFQANIVSNLWLTSDLPGLVEDPDYYFDGNSREINQHLDYLMMTQGWRRFRWEDVTETNSMEINYPIEQGLMVTGKITKEFFDIPLKNLPVTLTVLSEFNDVFISRTNARGEYKFELPDYEDTVYVEISARRLNGRKNLVIYIDEATRPESEVLYSSYTKEMTVQGSNVYRPREEEKEDTSQVILKGLYNEADHVIVVDESMRTYSSVLEILQGRVPGVMVSGNSVQIRGPSSFILSTEPLYLIDNIPVDVNAIQSINPLDIDRIEIIKGPKTAIYGSRGANGVIAVFTKRGRFMKRGVIDFRMHGYHRAREFYSPRYGTEFDHLIEDTRTTLFWHPVIMCDEEGQAWLSFYNSGKKGTFWVLVEGVSDSGIPGRAEIRYNVE